MDISPSSSFGLEELPDDGPSDGEELANAEDYDDMVTDVPSPSGGDFYPDESFFPSDKLEHVLAGLNRLPSWVVYPLEVAECLYHAVHVARSGKRCGLICCVAAPRAGALKNVVPIYVTQHTLPCPLPAAHAV